MSRRAKDRPRYRVNNPEWVLWEARWNYERGFKWAAMEIMDKLFEDLEKGKYRGDEKTIATQQDEDDNRDCSELIDAGHYDVPWDEDYGVGGEDATGRSTPRSELSDDERYEAWFLGYGN